MPGTRKWEAGTRLGHDGSIAHLTECLKGYTGVYHLAAIGHRVVHGGLKYSQPTLVNAEVLANLEKFIALAPLHQPHNLAPIRVVAERTPQLPQVACFDTGFHRMQPRAGAGFRAAGHRCEGGGRPGRRRAPGQWREHVRHACHASPDLINHPQGIQFLVPMLNEAAFCLYESLATAQDIDNVMKLGMAHPMGPLALADLIGLDVCLSVLEVLYEGFKDPKYRPCPPWREKVDAGHLSRKSGRGFFEYASR